MKLRARDILFAEVNYAMPNLLDAQNKPVQHKVFQIVSELRDSLMRVISEGVELVDDFGFPVNLKNYSVNAVVIEEIEAYLNRRAEFAEEPTPSQRELQGIVTEIGSGHLVVTVDGKNSYNVRGGLGAKATKLRPGDEVKLRVADSSSSKSLRGYLLG